MPKKAEKTSFIHHALDAVKVNLEDYGGTSFFFVAGQRAESGEIFWEIWSSNKMDEESIIEAFKNAVDSDNFRQIGRTTPH